MLNHQARSCMQQQLQQPPRTPVYDFSTQFSDGGAAGSGLGQEGAKKGDAEPHAIVHAHIAKMGSTKVAPCQSQVLCNLPMRPAMDDSAKASRSTGSDFSPVGAELPCMDLLPALHKTIVGRPAHPQGPTLALVVSGADRAQLSLLVWDFRVTRVGNRASGHTHTQTEGARYTLKGCRCRIHCEGLQRPDTLWRAMFSRKGRNMQEEMTRDMASPICKHTWDMPVQHTWEMACLDLHAMIICLVKAESLGTIGCCGK
eukprot:1161909-Pelagomonas_calceolata.AAC.25